MLVVQSDCQVSIFSGPGASVQINAMLAFFIKAKGYLYVSFAFNQALKNSKLFGQAYLRGYSKSRKKQSSGLRCFLSKPCQGLHQPLLNCAIVLFWCYTFKFCLLKFSLSSGSNYPATTTAKVSRIFPYHSTNAFSPSFATTKPEVFLLSGFMSFQTHAFLQNISSLNRSSNLTPFSPLSSYTHP